MVCLQRAARRENKFLELEVSILCNVKKKKAIVEWLNEWAITEKFKLQKRVDRARGRCFNVAQE